MIELARATQGSNAIEYSIAIGAIALCALVGFRTFGDSVVRTSSAQSRCVDTLERGCVVAPEAVPERAPVEGDPTAPGQAAGVIAERPMNDGAQAGGGAATKRQIAALTVATLRVALGASREATEQAHRTVAEAFDDVTKVKLLPNVTKIATTAGNRSTAALESGVASDFKRAADAARNSAWAYDGVAKKAETLGLTEVATVAKRASAAMKDLAASHETNRELSERLVDANSLYARAALEDDAPETED